MLKLTLDWAGESPAPLGESDEGLVIVEQVSAKGPNGWPVIAVYVRQAEFEPAHAPAMRLIGWLEEVYGVDGVEEAEELADLAVEV